ncbi:hypothetical protein AYM39_04075 [Methylomonas sp. DH-1]|nr:hypothetical protein AYM39_04075 [Methylomonas sp. DH-1]
MEGGDIRCHPSGIQEMAVLIAMQVAEILNSSADQCLSPGMAPGFLDWLSFVDKHAIPGLPC